MSKTSPKHRCGPAAGKAPLTTCTTRSILRCFLTALIALAGLSPWAANGSSPDDGSHAVPRLVKVRTHDTPATLSRRYLQDDDKGWMILEYNEIPTLPAGRPVLVPVAPFRRGGLTPDSYQTVPVLAYADVGDTSLGPTRLSPTAFREQLDWLQTHGFTTVDPTLLIAFMEFKAQLPQRSVMLTFDTTSLDFIRIVFPILQKRNLSATLFIATDKIGTAGTLSWDQVRQLHAAGIVIGCRGGSGHSLLRRKKRQSFQAYFRWVESELRRSKNEIESHLKARCLFLAYPKGDTSDLVRAMAAKLGFNAAWTLTPGDNPFFADRFAIHRIPMDSSLEPATWEKMIVTRIQADLK